MAASETDTRAPSSRPLLNAEAVFAVLGVVAFVGGVTKRWILDPLGEAFGELTPNAKSLVVVLVVLGVIAVVALSRWRHRLEVQAGRRVVDASFDGQ